MTEQSLRTRVAILMFGNDLLAGQRKWPASAPGNDPEIAWLHVTEETRARYIVDACEIIEMVEAELIER